jgi:hypothetical protein
VCPYLALRLYDNDLFVSALGALERKRPEVSPPNAERGAARPRDGTNGSSSGRVT